jgi:hypothetical protein
MLVCSNLGDWKLADVDVDGAKRWDVTHIKTRDAFTHDAVIITHEHIKFVDFYLTNIRPHFVKQYVSRKYHSKDVMHAHGNGMSLSSCVRVSKVHEFVMSIRFIRWPKWTPV